MELLGFQVQSLHHGQLRAEFVVAIELSIPGLACKGSLTAQGHGSAAAAVAAFATSCRQELGLSESASEGSLVHD